MIGSFAFDESPVLLQAYRMATGVRLQIPFKFSLAPVVRGTPAPMLSDIEGVLFASAQNQRVELGRLFCDSSYTAGYRNPDESQEVRANEGQMIWLGSFADLAFYNKLRDGGPVRFIIQPRWRLCYMFYTRIGQVDYQASTLPE